MSDGILGNATYKCSECGAKHYLQNDNFIFEPESGSERSMGQEIQYVAEFDEPCHKCSHDINLKFEVWEYPAGIINFTNEEATGAEIIDSDFEIYHEPPEEPFAESVKLLTPLLLFRFDRFSELFVDLWLSVYKKSPKQTAIISITLIVVMSTIIGAAIYKSEKSRKENLQYTQNYSNQYSILKDTEKNLNHLAKFIADKKGEIESTQLLLENLEQKKSELEPIVNANQEVIDAIFLQQKKELKKSIWAERWVSFGFGIFASLIASIIWHFVSKIRKKQI